jgi:hypothetical protein
MSEQATETGPLTVDAAIASLLPPETVENTAPEAPAAPAEAAEEPTEPQGEASTPEEPEAEPVEPAEGEEAEAEAEPVVAVDPPKYWSQDAKAKFAELSPDLQAVVLAQEGPREEAAAKAKAEAATAREAAEKELQGVGKLAEALAERLPQWISAFENRWGANPDWVGYAQEHGVEAMTLAKTQYEAERSQLVEAEQARNLAQTQAHDAFLKAEAAKLAEIAPELMDPEKGAQKRTEVAQYIMQQGITQDALQHISAAELSIAHKAMLWDRTQAALKAAPPKKPAAPAPKAPVRPSAPASAPNPNKQAMGRFHAKPDIDNAVALLLAPKG